MKYLLTVTILLSLFSKSSFASTTPCQSSGVSVTSSGNISCTLDVIFTESNGMSLQSQTFGIVNSVRLSTVLSANANDYDKYLRENGIFMPKQTINVRIETNGSPINAQVDLGPIIYLNSSQGQLAILSVNPNITRFESTLPVWVDDILKRRITAAAEPYLFNAARRLVQQLN